MTRPRTNDAQLTLPIFDSVEKSGGDAQPRAGTALCACAPTDDGVHLVGRAAKRTVKRDPRPMPKPGEPLDPIDAMLRDFARALIATAMYVHDEIGASGLAAKPKPQRQQGKSRARRVVVGRPDVVSSIARNDSGAAPLATADPVVPTPRRVET